MDLYLIKQHLVLFLLATIWALFWKGYAVWTAVKNDQKGWFIALLLLNTLGVLDIIYIFAVAKKKWSDVHKVFTSLMSLGK